MKWIITELFHPDEVSTAQILTDIAIKISQNETVHVICGPKGYERSYNCKKVELNSNIVVHRIKLPKLNKNSLIQRILRLGLLSFQMSIFVLKNIKKGDVVLQVTNPIFLILSTACIKSIKGFKLELIIHDVFPNNLIPSEILKMNSILFKVLDVIFNLAYNKADRLIVLGDDMKELMLKKCKKHPIAIDVIPNWADDNIYPFKNFKRDDYLKIDTKNKIVIGFAGNLGRVQGVLEFTKLFIKAANSSLELIIIGDGAFKLSIETLINSHKVKNVHVMGSRPRKEQIYFLNSCDLGLITLKSGMKGLGVPSKSYNIMAAAKPLFYIGDENSEIFNYINRHDCGWAFDWDTIAIILFLQKLHTIHNNEFTRKGINSFETVGKFHVKDIVLKNF